MAELMEEALQAAQAFEDTDEGELYRQLGLPREGDSSQPHGGRPVRTSQSRSRADGHHPR